MPYTLIDHTADFGIQVSAETLGKLFSQAAEALFDQITDRTCLKGKKKIHINITGRDRPDLMVNWLRELLYLWNGKEMLIKSVEIQSVSEKRLRADVAFDPYSPDKHVINSEIKAVTYHQIRVAETQAGWESRIIFDV